MQIGDQTARNTSGGDAALRCERFRRSNRGEQTPKGRLPSKDPCPERFAALSPPPTERIVQSAAKPFRVIAFHTQKEVWARGSMQPGLATGRTPCPVWVGGYRLLKPGRGLATRPDGKG